MFYFDIISVNFQQNKNKTKNINLCDGLQSELEINLFEHVTNYECQLLVHFERNSNQDRGRPFISGGRVVRDAALAHPTLSN